MIETGATLIQDTMVLSLAEGISFQPLGEGEGGVVLKVGSGQLFTCNDTTSAFLAAVDGRRSFADLVQAVLGEFEVAKDALRSDLGLLVDELQKEGIVSVQ
jgi:pyrroloquinoline quinone biosynthesis protein D